MPEGNPLVAAPQETTTAVTGIGIAESCVDLANGVSNGDWVEAGLGALGAGLEVLSMVIDPLGTLASYGVSWLIEHVRPLKEALDWFAGDPPVIRSFSETWANVAAEVDRVSADLAGAANGDTSGWRGAAGDAYRGQAAQTADALAGAGALASGISAGVMIMGEVVAFVREFIRDMVGELVGRLISWALEVAATLGLATPVVVAQATAAISKVVNKVADLVRKLVKTIGNVAPRIRKVIDKLDEIIEKLAKLMRRGDGPAGPDLATSPARHADDTPGLRSTDGTTGPANAPGSGTTPSGTDAPGAGRTDAPGTRTDPAASADPAGTNTGTSGSTNGRTDGSKPDRPLRQDAANPTDRAQPPPGRCGGREPVDLATGEMYLVQTDVRLDGLLPLVLERVHVSSYRSGQRFGPSWASTLDQRLEFDGRGVCYAGPDGVILVYPTPAADGTPVLPIAGARWPLGATPTGYAITQPATGRVLHFPRSTSGTAPIGAVTDRTGHRVDFDHGDSAITVRHSGGYEVRADTTGGLITRLSLVNRRGADVELARFDYDPARRLIAVVNSSGRPMRFEYDEAGRITKWVDRNDRWYAYHYDPAGRCVRTEGSGHALAGTIEYDPANRTTVETNSLGHRTTYQFDAAHKLVRWSDPLGSVTTQEWDAAGNLVARTDGLGRTIRYARNDDGDVVAVTRPDGSRLTAEYNELRQVVRMQGADGAVWRRDYDQRGNLRSVVNPTGISVRYSYDERGHLSSVTDPAGTRRIRTDAAGLPVAVTDASGATTHYVRDAFGRIATVTDANGNSTRTGWTVEGNLAYRTFPDGRTERWSHDGEGNRIEHVDVAGRVTRTTVTHLDLPAAVVDPTGAAHEFAYDTELRLTAVTNPLGLSWRYEYDAAGRLVREIDFNGRELTYAYDAAGQLVGRTNGAGQTVTFHHDLLGNVVERRTNDDIATFEYDAAGRMVRATNADAEISYERDPLGAVIAETVNGQTVHFGYDPAGRRTYRRTPSGLETWWNYRPGGRSVEMRTSGHSITLGYDPSGREIERLLDGGAVLAQRWDAADRLVGQTLTRRGEAELLQQRQYGYFPDGSVRSVHDHLTGVRQFETDPAGRTVAVSAAGWTERYAYDPAGNMSAANWPGPGAEAVGPREYAGTRLSSAGNVRYGYDAQGRVVVRSRKRPSAKSDVWQYEWNAEDRLVGVRTPDGTRWRYRYDAFGRRVSKQRLAGDGRTVAEQVDFAWDGAALIEQSELDGSSTTWDYEPGTFRAISQVDRQQPDGSQRFLAVVVDRVGTPTELVDPAGNLAWRGLSTLWGQNVAGFNGSVDTPLRFPGQYHDRETGLHYNYQRYYDPDSGRYQSADPLGLAPGPNPESYVPNPTRQVDPLGLSACDPHLFRGTSEGYPGSPNMQRVGVTPTSTDPAVATAFATESEQFGNGVVHIATPDDVAGVDRLPPSLGALEAEVPLDMSPTDFASRASHTIPVSQARQILADMGISVPSQITSKQALDAWLHQRTPMTEAQIAEFVRRATGA